MNSPTDQTARVQRAAKRLRVRKISMWAVYVPGQKAPMGLAETKRDAAKMVKAYQKLVDAGVAAWRARGK